MTGWRDFPSLYVALEEGAFLIKQDVRLLNREALQVAVEKTLPHVVRKYDLSPSRVDWFLPHYSSEYFRMKFYEYMKNVNFDIPSDRWFSNLSYKGNTGAASIISLWRSFSTRGGQSRGKESSALFPKAAGFP